MGDAVTDVATAQRLVSNGEARLLDVRETEEWEAGHIDGAVHIPLAQLGSRMKEVGAEADWLAICRSGSRSDRAAEFLRNGGLSIRNVSGGVRAWVEAGLPFVAADGGPGQVI